MARTDLSILERPRPDAHASALAACHDENDARARSWSRAWLTSAEAAVLLDTSERAVWCLAQAGDLTTASQDHAPRRLEVVRGPSGHVAVVETAMPIVLGIRFFSRGDVMQIVARLAERRASSRDRGANDVR